VSRFLTAQIGYTVPFTSVYAGNYGQKTNQKQTLLKVMTTQKKTTQNSKIKLPWFSHLLRHSARKWGGLILLCSRAQMRQKKCTFWSKGQNKTKTGHYPPFQQR